MSRKLLRIGILFLLSLGLTVGTLLVTGSREPLIACMMDNWQGGNGHMTGNWQSGNGQDMQDVHQLFANYQLIRRTVEEIPGGVRTVTESDNPQIAALIQRHVASMHQRLDEGRWFAMMSRTLPIMFRNADRYQREFELTPKGISVRKTSDDPELASILREHSREVSGFVEGGMPCMGGGGGMRWR